MPRDATGSTARDERGPQTQAAPTGLPSIPDMLEELRDDREARFSAERYRRSLRGLLRLANKMFDDAVQRESLSEARAAMALHAAHPDGLIVDGVLHRGEIADGLWRVRVSLVEPNAEDERAAVAEAAVVSDGHVAIGDLDAKVA